MTDTLTPQCTVAWVDAHRKSPEAINRLFADMGIGIHSSSDIADLAACMHKMHALICNTEGDLEVLQECLSASNVLGRRIPVVCRIPSGQLNLAVEAMRLGALHVVSVDDSSAEAWEPVVALMQSTPTARRPRSVVFVDPVSQQLLSLARRVAQTEVTALLYGPTGAGKEVLARVLHEASPRSTGPFVSLNCGAMPEHLVEDMLFGHDKGAFSGAIRDHKGLFEQANGGTVFLDEIGEMPLHLQTRLLRVLQERQVTRLGGQRSIPVNVRVIAATNKNLKQAMLVREFREDLYYRISTFSLTVPPLYKRPGDIIPLASYFLLQYGQSNGRQVITPAACQRLLDHHWPGNVRELENVVQRAIVLSGPHSLVDVHHLLFDDEDSGWSNAQPGPASVADDGLPRQHQSQSAAESHHENVSRGRVERGGAISPDEFTHPPVNDEAAFPTASSPIDISGGLQSLVRSSELQVIQEAIRKTPSREAAARLLGISPRTLRYKLAQMRNLGLTMAEAVA